MFANGVENFVKIARKFMMKEGAEGLQTESSKKLKSIMLENRKITINELALCIPP